MSPAAVTFKRTVSSMFSLYSTAFAFAVFFAAASVSFVFGIEAAEGTRMPLAALWCSSVSPVLCVLPALAGMGVWSDEKLSGTLGMLLSSPVRERDLVVGKFLGVWLASVTGVVVFCAASLVSLAVFAPALVADVSIVSFAPAVAALLLQGMLWSAVTVAASAFFTRAAAAAAAALFISAVLPRVVWNGARVFSGFDAAEFGEMPLDAHAFDMASGTFSVGAVVFYAAFAWLSLFIASKKTALARIAGAASSASRFSARVSVFLAASLACLAASLAWRSGAVLDFRPGGADAVRFSARTYSLLGESRGGIKATLFMPRKDPHFKTAAHFMRSFTAMAGSAGGARISLRYVDPSWDVGAAGRFARLGIKPGTVVFERGGRRESVALGETFSERACASAVRKVSSSVARRKIFWTCGHGENSFDSYDAWGMSDIARDLARDGYENTPLDLSSVGQIPADAAFVIVAGARQDFSRIETGRLDAYLRQGGRLMALFPGSEIASLSSLLSQWGLRSARQAYPSAKTLTGTDVIVSEFSDGHPVTASLAGARIVLEKPLSFLPSAAAGTAAGLAQFTPLALVGNVCVAAAAERGGGAGMDVSLRPTRIIAVGDDGFVLNGQLEAKANANRDFFLNSAAYLSGTDAIAGADTGFGRLVSGLDRREMRRLAATFGAFSLAAFVFLSALAAKGSGR
ncbi:MAG: Gldg family protein [Kiritimatiellae bacterium]|nr:Gldg family protein [Kiritimatiellia bacterium]